HGAREPGERVAAEVVHGAAPLGLFHGPRAHLQVLAQEDARGADAFQVLGAIRLAGERDDLVAQAVEDVDRDAADPAGGAGHDDRSLVGVLVVLLHAVHGERGGEAGGADLHGVARAHAGGNGHHGVAFDARVFGVTAVARLAEPAAVD